jgi:outer membrane biosynthesis protein TonB
MLVVSVFAQNPNTKPDKTQQTATATQAHEPYRFRVSEDVQKAKLVHIVSPLYPPLTGKRIDGTVVLHVIIGADGSVKSAKPVSGLPNLRDSAVSAVLQWKYRQSFMNGEACEIDTTVSVVFPPPVKQEPLPPNK